jgi:hypothetical protein
MVRPFIFINIFLFIALTGHGQTFEFNDLKKLPPVINSTAEESMPMLSPDLAKLFFVRSIYDGNMGGKYAGSDIWCSEKTATGWSSPSNRFDFLNDKDNNVLIGIHGDGKTLYTLNSSPSTKLEGIYFIKFDGKKWSRQEFIAIPGINNQDFVGVYVSVDYDAIFISMRGEDTQGEEDLYVCTKNAAGNWSRPKNIGATINTSGYEISPFLSADKKRLYFSSNGHGGQGDADIFYSERLYNSWETWSAPVNLGPAINSKKFDAYFSNSGDSLVFFTSNRDQQMSDIFTAKVSTRSSLLLPGESYLTKEEWNAIVGKNINGKMTFKKGATGLTSSQKELLYFIANKIAIEKDIKVHLVAKEEEDASRTKLRLREIYGELRQAGVDSDRIREEQSRESIKVAELGVVEVLLFRVNDPGQ